MRFAVISDLHSNIEALTAVFADIDAKKIETVYCLGDVVGYGPDPEPCIDLVRERCAWCIRGNHDDALFGNPDRFNPYARGAINWTKDRIKPRRFFPSKLSTERWGWMQAMITEKRIGEFYFVHGSPRDHVNEYIYQEDVFFNADGKLRAIFAVIDKALFVGHTHMPVIISNSLKTFVPNDKSNEFVLGDGKYIVNVGSVGQPRDRDIRSCWVEVDGQVVRYHRVSYEVNKVVQKIKSEPALDPVLGTRLLEGA